MKFEQKAIATHTSTHSNTQTQTGAHCKRKTTHMTDWQRGTREKRGRSA